MVLLGGNITVEGFENEEPGKLVVAKKMVGLFVKKAIEALGKADSFRVVKKDNAISVEIKSGEKIIESSAEEANLFMCLSKALASALEKAKQ